MKSAHSSRSLSPNRVFIRMSQSDGVMSVYIVNKHGSLLYQVGSICLLLLASARLMQ